jgi:hypothetical protein
MLQRPSVLKADVVGASITAKKRPFLLVTEADTLRYVWYVPELTMK